MVYRALGYEYLEEKYGIGLVEFGEFFLKISNDVLGAMIAGFEPESDEHIALYTMRNNRSLDLSSFTLRGPHPDEFKRPLEYDFTWRQDNTGPKNWDRLGVSGISIPKYDQTICTGCSTMYSPLLMLLTSAYKGKPFEGIEVLSGKKMRPSPGFNKTVLFGNCMIRKNRKNSNIKEAVYIKDGRDCETA